MTWPIKQLGEIATLNPKKSEVKELPDDTEISFVPMTALDDATQSIISPDVRKLGSVRKGYTYFKNGDVLFAKITPCMENGKVAIAQNLKSGVGFGSTEFHVIRPTANVLAEWIFYIVGSPIFREKAEKHMTGTAGQQRVPVEFLENVNIPLPPIEIQKKIVEKIEGLFAKIDEASRLCDESSVVSTALLPSALHHIFSRAEKEGWEETELNRCAKFIDYRGKTPRKIHQGLPLITAKNVKWGFLSKEPKEFVNPDIYDTWMTRGIPEKGDVLFTTEAPLGNVAQLDTDGKVIFAQRIIILHAQTNTNPTYLKYCLMSGPMRERIYRVATGTMAKGIRSKYLKTITIPLPPLPEQKKIVAHLDALSQKSYALKELQKQTAGDLSALKQSILHQAFGGMV